LNVRVEVVYALAAHQSLAVVDLDDAATVADALAAVADKPPFSELDLATVPVGIHGEPAARAAPLADGDRVEIYRPLRVDPREARRRRARCG